MVRLLISHQCNACCLHNTCFLYQSPWVRYLRSLVSSRFWERASAVIQAFWIDWSRLQQVHKSFSNRLGILRKSNVGPITIDKCKCQLHDWSVCTRTAVISHCVHLVPGPHFACAVTFEYPCCVQSGNSRHFASTSHFQCENRGEIWLSVSSSQNAGSLRMPFIFKSNDMCPCTRMKMHLLECASSQLLHMIFRCLIFYDVLQMVVFDVLHWNK